MSRDDQEASHERWLVSYADFITLMFAFFVVLYATSERDSEKTKEFQESIKRYLIKAGAFGDSGQQINQGQKNNSPIEAPIPTFKDGKPESIEVLDRAEAYVDSNLTKEERTKYLLDLVSDDTGVRLVVSTRALYDDGADKFKKDALPFVNKIARLLDETKRKILIEGHVAAGEAPENRSAWEFASARALNFLRYLESREGISSQRLSMMSLGDSRPIYSGTRSAQNARLEIVILNSDSEF